jgi:hypothetical protein
MPCSFNSAAAPTPDNCNSCGDNSEPPAEQYLAAGADPADSAVLRVFEADRALAVEQHAMGKGADLDLQIRPLHRRPQIGDRGAAPAHFAHRQLIVADPFLLGAIEIGVSGKTRFLAAGGEGVVQLVAGAQIGDVERATGAVIIVGAALLVLGAAEIGQHVVIAPADAAELAPVVEILFLAADINQAVDRGGAAQHLPARPGDAAPVEPRYRLGLELPGNLRVIDVAVEPGRNVDPEIAVLAAGLDHQNARAGIGREPVGQHAAGRTGADDDKIVFRVEIHQLLQLRNRVQARCNSAPVRSCKSSKERPGTMSVTTNPRSVTSMTARSV